ncbi:MAG: CCA tRNA nucleotidyltransferase [Nitrospiraceae bacterium]|nr:MAG: CCA tRNA nucleotidyltransferase [Nitrospiraceae bacterium]
MAHSYVTTLSLKDWLSCKNINITEWYLVGGTVRDLLLGSSPKDIDLVCKGAKKCAQAIAQCNNAALVHMEKKPGEPCYRVVDREDSDNYIDIAEMRGETIYDDLSQRDFTIDAIAAVVNENSSAGLIIDPLKGQEDIKAKIIRQTSEKSIVSDPLRILRAFRLSASLGFTIEEQTAHEMKKRAVMLKDVSSERIMTELLLILRTPHSSDFFRQMDRLGMLEVIFPEIRAMKDCPRNGFHHKDVWEHSFLVMEYAEHIIGNLPSHFREWSSDIQQYLNRSNRLPLLKLIALLHDIGKPSTKSINPDSGKITFYGHDAAGAGMIDSVAGRLKVSSRDRDFMVLLTAEHLHVPGIVSENTCSATRTRWYRKMGDDSTAAIILGMSDVMGSQGIDSTQKYRERFVSRAQQCVIDYYENLKGKIESPNLVSGKDIIILGMEPGPEMGIILERIRAAQDSGEISSREEALELAKKMISLQD